MSLISFLYLFLTGALLALLLYLIALAPLLEKAPASAVLAYNDVKGMAVESEGMLYTLNFKQQNRIVAALNKQEEILEIEGCVRPLPLDKLVIYRFNAPEWVLTLKVAEE